MTDSVSARLLRSSRAWVIRNILLPAADAAFGHPMMRRLRFLRQAQWWDPERIQRAQRTLLEETIRTAYESTSFYRELMQGAGLRPEHIRTPEDLRRIPVVTKQMLRDAYPQGVTRPVPQKCYEARTSGSTGSNFAVLEDRNTAAWYRASFLLALEWAGWTVGEPHLQNGVAQRNWQKRAKDFCIGCHYVSASALSNEDLDATLAILERRRLDHLWGYPGSLYLLAKHAAQLGWNRPMKTVVTWGDMLYPQYRKVIEAAFGRKVIDTYGCGEGIQIAAQCGVADGLYHRHDLDVVVQFEPENGSGGDASHAAPLVLTRLHAGPLPLIRYRLGDLAIEGSGSQCTCGRGFSMLHSIQGRETDIITTPSGNRLIVHFFTGILEHFKEIESFLVIQEEADALRLLIVPAETLSLESRRRIAAAITGAGVTDMTIRVEVVPEIPLPASGKRRFVISRMAAKGAGAPYDPATPGNSLH